jgi:hypothetical protein
VAADIKWALRVLNRDGFEYIENEDGTFSEELRGIMYKQDYTEQELISLAMLKADQNAVS